MLIIIASNTVSASSPSNYSAWRGASHHPLPSNGSTEDLSAEETTLCPLDDLLVDGLRGMVHDDCALLIVDLCVDAGVSDEVDDPLLALVLRETEARGEVPVRILLVA